MAGKPYQSILTLYMSEIIALRRKKPPMSYSQIVVLLREKYQITIRGESIGFAPNSDRQFRNACHVHPTAYSQHRPQAMQQTRLQCP